MSGFHRHYEHFEVSKSRVLFRYNFFTGSFDGSQYHPKMTCNEISKKEVASFLKGADEVINQSGFRRALLSLAKLYQILWPFTTAIIAGMIWQSRSGINMIPNDILSFTLVLMLTALCLFMFRLIVKVPECMKNMKNYINSHASNSPDHTWNWRSTFGIYIEIYHDQELGSINYGQNSTCDLNAKNSTLLFHYQEWRSNFRCKSDLFLETEGKYSPKDADEVLEGIRRVIFDHGLDLRYKVLEVFTILTLGSLLVVMLLRVWGRLVDYNFGEPLTVLSQLSVLLLPSYIYFFTKLTFIDGAEVRSEILPVIEDFNDKISKKGLRWYIPEAFPSFVELWKDYTYYDAQTGKIVEEDQDLEAD